MNPLLKNVLAAVGGYVVMALLVFVMFTALWLILGADGSFEADSWNVSATWAITSVVLGLLAAVAGGSVAARLGATHQAVLFLIVLVVILGIVSAIPDGGAAGVARPADVSMFDAMGSAIQPRWAAWLNPVIGAIGVAIGGRHRG